MDAGYIIVLMLWGIIAVLIMVEYIPFCKDLSPSDRMAVFFILTIGAPVIAANNVITLLLDAILPEGWDDDNGRNGFQ